MALSLRDQDQLDGLALGRNGSLSMTYGGPDTYHTPQDAAKLVIPPNQGSFGPQLYVPINVTAPDTVWLIWDAWWGPEWHTERDGMHTQKTFMIATNRTRSGHWWENRLGYGHSGEIDDDGHTRLGFADVRGYMSQLGPGTSQPDSQRLQPLLAHFYTHEGVWHRYWQKIEMTSDNWATVSVWIADEDRDPVALYQDLVVSTDGDRLTNFWFEFNTSQERVGGALVAYLRNHVTIRNPQSPIPFERPVA